MNTFITAVSLWPMFDSRDQSLLYAIRYGGRSLRLAASLWVLQFPPTSSIVSPQHPCERDTFTTERISIRRIAYHTLRNYKGVFLLYNFHKLKSERHAPKSDDIHENINTFTLLTFDFLSKNIYFYEFPFLRVIVVLLITRLRTDAIVTPLRREYGLQEKLYLNIKY